MSLIRLGVDPLEEALLRRLQPVAGLLGQGVEVVHVIRRGHLQGELGVLQREEPRRAGHPVQPVPVGVDLGEQVVVDLGGALPAADDGDALLGLQLCLALQVRRGVQQVAGEVANGRGQVRLGPGAEHQPARRVGLRLAGGADVDGHGVAVPGRVVRHLGDPVPEAQVAELRRGPPAVRVVLAAQREEALPDVERVEPPGLLQVLQERVRRGRVGQGHQVGDEGRLQGGRLQQHAGVPVELVRASRKSPSRSSMGAVRQASPRL